MKKLQLCIGHWSDNSSVQEITEGAQEQEKGVEQINMAVYELDKITQS